jgi:hypothetical protein
MPATVAIFRMLALTVPNAIESAHMGHPDFRVLCADGKLRIFATLSAEVNGRGVLKLTLDQQASFCEELPQVFEPCGGGWGRMGMTYVHLDRVDQDTLLGALTTAHHNVTSKIEASKPKRVTAVAKKARKPMPAKPKIKS